MRGRRHAAAALALWAAAGCGRPASGGPVEIRFWAMGSEGEQVAAMVPEFERRNPGIRVRVQQIPWTAAHEKVLTAFVGDATPDVAQLGNTWVPELQALDALEELGPWMARSPGVEKDDYFPGIWDTNVIGEGVYGIPWYVDTRVLFYRSDLLARAGYTEMPATWEGWREAMRQLQEQMEPGAYPILLPTNEWPQPVILGMQSGAPLLRGDGEYGNFADPRFRRGFGFYVSLFREGLAPAVSASEIANLHQEFARGRIAMVITGPWQVGEFTRRVPAEIPWATAPLPGPDGPGTSLAGGSSLVVFRGSRHREAAWKLVEFLSGPAQQLRLYELTGDLPARRSTWQDSALARDPRMAAFRAQLERVRPLPKVPEAEQIVNQVFEQGERAARGQASVEQATEALDRTVDRLLEKRRWLLARRREQAAQGAEAAHE